MEIFAMISENTASRPEVSSFSLLQSKQYASVKDDKIRATLKSQGKTKGAYLRAVNGFLLFWQGYRHHSREIA